MPVDEYKPPEYTSYTISAQPEWADKEIVEWVFYFYWQRQRLNGELVEALFSKLFLDRKYGNRNSWNTVILIFQKKLIVLF